MSVYDGRPPRPNPEPWPADRVPTNNLERLIASAPRPPETPKPERRVALVAAPPAVQLDADNLPPLPPATEGTVTGARRWSASRMWEYADQAIAPYAERIRLLERELATFKAEHATLRAGQSIGDDRTFQRLLVDFGAARFQDVQTTHERVIAYIDGRTAGTASEAAPEIDPFAAQRFLNWNRSQPKPLVEIGKELGIARKVLEFAAAPSTQEGAK